MNMGFRAREGVLLLCLAEALLRIPDAATADRLIAGTIGSGDWGRHLGHSNSLLVNASTYGLMLTGRVIDWGEGEGNTPAGMIQRLIGRSGEPVIRQALRQAMRILGGQFVLGQTIDEALANAEDEARAGLSLLLRHAGGGGAHRRGREPLCRALSRGGRGHRGLGGLAASARRGRAACAARSVGEAVGTASALPAFARGAAARGAAARGCASLRLPCARRGCRSPSMPRSRTSSS